MRGRWMAVAGCLAALMGATVFGARGGGEDDKPTEVSAGDLKKDGEFWSSLTPDLKTDMVEFAQEKLGGERPDGADEINAVPAEKGVDGLDNEYSNESKRSETIQDTYRTVNDELAGQRLDELMPHLDGESP